MEFVKMNESGKIEISIRDYNFLILQHKKLQLVNWCSPALHPEYDGNNFIKVDGKKLTGFSKLEYEFECANKGE